MGAVMNEAAGSVNLLAVLLAAISAFVLGGAWYSKAMFLNAWAADPGQATKTDHRHPAKIFGGAFICSLIAAYVFAMFLGPSPGIAFGVGAGVATGFGFVAMSFGINYLFEGKSLKLFLINGGYHVVQFTLYGVIIGWMQ